jgi:hypothetical protein
LPETIINKDNIKSLESTNREAREASGTLWTDTILQKKEAVKKDSLRENQ